ncbi:30S ribosomal protein S1 [Anaeromyxobacter dehalogenans]|uniref:30S ribosomal protein S1 n=1 Tax=Anaeromyxobacter dehalogenans TaxID=161493 RepID=UPI000051C459|nr:S1 RNA-binding domain-containing protein [Anaeromyxobacter dehalogenans]
MSDQKKPESPGPVVIRKGHVKPPPPGAKIEAPEEERLAPATSQPAPAAQDRRPLWQRVAEERSPRPAPGGAGPQQRGGPRGPRPAGGGPRGERRPRGDRPERREHGEVGPAAALEPPRPPAGEPPPAPEVEAPDEGSFADMLAGSEAGPRRRFQVGEKVAGKIIQIGEDVAFLELGSGVAEAMIETVELKDEAGNLAARVGDIIDAVVVKATDRGAVVSKGHGRATRDHAREAVIEAAHTGLPVEGVVKAVNKGGLEVEVHGVRAFCPISQIDVRFVGDASAFVGQKLLFKVTRADGRDAVLSRRALLEEERAQKAAETRARLAPGAVFDGVVTSVQDYGAFVDIGGVEGLVHVSELAWDRVSKPQDLLSAGDAVQVQVLRIDEDPKKGERIGLSVKALAPRPEPAAPAPGAEGAERPARPSPPPPPRVGDVVQATVDKVESFGVFVRFAGGRGLVPASETGTPRGADLRRSFKVGDTIQALVSAIDEQGRIRLSKTEAEHAAERAEAREYMAKAPRAQGKGFGTLGDLLRQKLEKK